MYDMLNMLVREGSRDAIGQYPANVTMTADKECGDERAEVRIPQFDPRLGTLIPYIRLAPALHGPLVPVPVPVAFHFEIKYLTCLPKVH